MSKQDQILKFLKERPLISLRALEKACNLPDTKITQVRNGKQNFKPEHIEAIEKALEPYCFKFNS